MASANRGKHFGKEIVIHLWRWSKIFGLFCSECNEWFTIFGEPSFLLNFTSIQEHRKFGVSFHTTSVHCQRKDQDICQKRGQSSSLHSLVGRNWQEIGYQFHYKKDLCLIHSSHWNSSILAFSFSKLKLPNISSSTLVWLFNSLDHNAMPCPQLLLKANTGRSPIQRGNILWLWTHRNNRLCAFPVPVPAAFR